MGIKPRAFCLLGFVPLDAGSEGHRRSQWTHTKSLPGRAAVAVA